MTLAQPWPSSRIAQLSRQLGVGGVMVVLMVAGLLKLMDLQSFFLNLEAWPIPVSMRAPTAILLPTIEVIIGACWFLRIVPGFMERVSIGLLASFLVMLVFAAYSSEPPRCSCFGLVEKYFEDLGSLRAAIWRDAVMLGVLSISVFVPPKSMSQSRCHPKAVRPSLRSGFSLIEALIVLVIIALLIALLSPSFVSLRRAAQRTKTLAHLAGNGKVMATYTNDWRGEFPAFMDPRATSTVLRLASGRVEQIDGYFAGSYAWHLALADGYFGGDPNTPSVYPAEQASIGRGGTPFLYPCTFFAKPEFWNPATRNGPTQFGGQGESAVLFPSKKAILVSCFDFIYPPVRDAVVPMCMVDGSAAAPLANKVSSGYATGDGSYFPASFHPSDWFAGLHTIDGLRGRDMP